MLQFLDEDDKPHDEARINGYLFGERVLEDVYFHGKIVNGAVQVFVPKDSPADQYLKRSRISAAKWIKIIQESALDHYDSWEALDGSGDLYLTDVEGPAPVSTSVPRQIGKVDISAVIKGLKKP